MYTLEDLEKAQSELKEWNEKWSNYSGNNPDKYQSDIKSARSLVRNITDYLKSNGTIELTPEEQLEKELDVAFPNAQSKEVVEHNGSKYQRKFSPIVMTRSRKNVKEWRKEWIKVS